MLVSASDRFHAFTTYFDIPAAYLCALLIDLHDAAIPHICKSGPVHTEDDLELFEVTASDISGLV